MGIHENMVSTIGIESVNGISNIRLLKPRFRFDEYPETLIRIRQGQPKYSRPNIRIFDIKA